MLRLVFYENSRNEHIFLEMCSWVQLRVADFYWPFLPHTARWRENRVVNKETQRLGGESGFPSWISVQALAKPYHTVSEPQSPQLSSKDNNIIYPTEFSWDQINKNRQNTQQRAQCTVASPKRLDSFLARQTWSQHLIWGYLIPSQPDIQSKILWLPVFSGASLVAQIVTESACNAGGLSSISGPEAPMEKGMVANSSILAWRIPSTLFLTFYIKKSKVGQNWVFIVNVSVTYYSPCVLFIYAWCYNRN